MRTCTSPPQFWFSCVSVGPREPAWWRGIATAGSRSRGDAGMTATIEFDNVSKWFGGVVAVSEVTLAIEPGVTALLGPNGAGKSTVLRLMCGLTSPSGGVVRVKGRNPRQD